MVKIQKLPKSRTQSPRVAWLHAQELQRIWLETNTITICPSQTDYFAIPTYIKSSPSRTNQKEHSY